MALERCAPRKRALSPPVKDAGKDRARFSRRPYSGNVRTHFSVGIGTPPEPERLPSAHSRLSGFGHLVFSMADQKADTGGDEIPQLGQCGHLAGGQLSIYTNPQDDQEDQRHDANKGYRLNPERAMTVWGWRRPSSSCTAYWRSPDGANRILSAKRPRLALASRGRLVSSGLGQGETVPAVFLVGLHGL